MKLREIVDLANLLDQIAEAKTFDYNFTDDGIWISAINEDNESYDCFFQLDVLKKGV
jgi:hypothetical protein